MKRIVCLVLTACMLLSLVCMTGCGVVEEFLYRDVTEESMPEGLEWQDFFDPRYESYGEDVYHGDVKWCVVEETGTLYISGTGDMPNGDAEDGCYFGSGNQTLSVENGEWIQMTPWYAYETPEIVHRVVIGNGVTSIGDGSFCNLTSLKEVKLSKTVKKIGDHAFDGCSSLAGIALPKGLKSMGDFAFANSGLTEITLSPALTKIPSGTFIGCAALTKVSLYSKILKVEDSAFSGCSSLIEIKLPEKVDEIGERAFYGCTALSAIEIPDGVQSIPNEAFFNCTALESIKFPASLTEIGSYAFGDCASLAQVNFPEGIESIGDGAFSNCALQYVGVPGGTLLGSNAFDSSCKVDMETLPEEGASEDESREEYGTETDSVPGTVPTPPAISLSWQQFDTCDLKWAFDADTNTLYISGTGNMVIRQQVNVFVAPWINHTDSIRKVVIENGVTSIADGAFYGCEKMESISLPASLKTIGTYAFHSCSSLKALEIPSQVFSVNPSAFAGCGSLTRITFNGGDFTLADSSSALQEVSIRGKVVYVSADTFFACEKLSKVELYGSEVHIMKNAFRNCRIDKLYVSNITEIGEGAFEGSRVKEIYFDGTLQEAERSRLYYVYSLDGVTIHCSDGDGKIDYKGR